MRVKKLGLVFVLLQSFLFLVFSICVRDPFNLVQENKIVGSNQTNENIELVGVINVGDDFGAILRHGICQEVVFLNDQIWGYTVKEITLDHVFLAQADRKLKLQIG